MFPRRRSTAIPVAEAAAGGSASGCPIPCINTVNQGPTYSGPGNFAPHPVYQETAISTWGAYRHRHHHYGPRGPVLRRYY